MNNVGYFQIVMNLNDIKTGSKDKIVNNIRFQSRLSISTDFLEVITTKCTYDSAPAPVCRYGTYVAITDTFSIATFLAIFKLAVLNIFGVTLVYVSVSYLFITLPSKVSKRIAFSNKGNYLLECRQSLRCGCT